MKKQISARGRVASKAAERKLSERSAVLYGRELERWNQRPLGYQVSHQG